MTQPDHVVDDGASQPAAAAEVVGEAGTVETAPPGGEDEQ